MPDSQVSDIQILQLLVPVLILAVSVAIADEEPATCLGQDGGVVVCYFARKMAKGHWLLLTLCDTPVWQPSSSLRDLQSFFHHYGTCYYMDPFLHHTYPRPNSRPQLARQVFQFFRTCRLSGNQKSLCPERALSVHNFGKILMNNK